jgi:hypothetical protein
MSAGRVWLFIAALCPAFLDGALLQLTRPAVVFVRHADADWLDLIPKNER